MPLGAGVTYTAEPMADEAIAPRLGEAGMTDIQINRAGDGKAKISETVNGQGAVLVYEEATGNLESYDGNSPGLDAHAAFLAPGAWHESNKVGQ